MTHWRKSKAITCSQDMQTSEVTLMTNLALCPEDFRDCSVTIHNPSIMRHSLEAQEEETRGIAREGHQELALAVSARGSPLLFLNSPLEIQFESQLAGKMERPLRVDGGQVNWIL